MVCGQLVSTASWDLCTQRGKPESDLDAIFFGSNARGEVEGPQRGAVLGQKVNIIKLSLLPDLVR